MTTATSAKTDDYPTTSVPTVTEKIPHARPTTTTEKLQESYQKVSTWTTRARNYFVTHDGRIALVTLLLTLTCVIVQHALGTCQHWVGATPNSVAWNVFVPPFGAGPHTAVFFFVLSWTTFVYCLQRIWVYLTTGVRLSKKRDLVVHGLIAALYFIAFAFNIWGYVLCESAGSGDVTPKSALGVCRGKSQACIPLLAGVLVSCAAACAFCAEHILALTQALKARQRANVSEPSRILP